MKVVRIKLDSIDKVKKFVSLTTMADMDIDLVSGRYIIDAKSIMGIFSIDLTKVIEVHIHSDNAKTVGEFLETIKEFIVQ